MKNGKEEIMGVKSVIDFILKFKDKFKYVHRRYIFKQTTE